MQINVGEGSGQIRKGICYIIAAGKIENVGWLRNHVRPGAMDFCIAADGGYDTCVKNRIPVNLVVGDFDSLGHAPNHPNVITMPCEKDDTDLFYAVRVGLKEGYRVFQIYGATGGRPGHTMANYQTLAFLSEQGACGILCEPNVQITAIHNDILCLPAYAKGFVSIFSMSDESTGVSIEGLKYSLQNHTLTSDIPLGVSNEFMGEKSTISVVNGTLLIMWETRRV